ncbi:alpha/beta hydrolase [Nocardia arizonensis]|uniref:alpha/beta hydrolase n=1 Tax=Nocardia arizonensis TaxID=1141647 RepID=UPI000AA6816A|nr:alpha/beta hydrolase family protein [Nocardia arizonensis]
MKSMLFRRDARSRLGIVTVTAALLAGVIGGEIPFATAEPDIYGTGSSEGSPPTYPEAAGPTRPEIDRVEPITDRWLRVFVRSPAMARTVEVQVLLPRDRAGARPTVYTLDGRTAEPNGNNWIEHGHAAGFFEDKNVNVVLTVGGPASFYTDWLRTDPVLGTNRWESFLTRELPPLIDAGFDGNGRNGVMGVSMGAEAAMMLTVRRPDLYRAVAAHSGCYAISTDSGQAQARAIVLSYRGQPDNMFGAPDDPQWYAHDVVAHAEALRGKAIYLSTGNGLPGRYDVPGDPDLPSNVVLGGPLEAGAAGCTHALVDRLTRLDIPFTANFRDSGTHSWPYWADELGRSWPVMAGALGVS